MQKREYAIFWQITEGRAMNIISQALARVAKPSEETKQKESEEVLKAICAYRYSKPAEAGRVAQDKTQEQPTTQRFGK